MSANVGPLIAASAGSTAGLNDAPIPSIDRHKHISLSKQQAAARGPVACDLASSHPSVNGANLHATQLRNFTLRQKLFARGAVVPHSPSPSFYLRPSPVGNSSAARVPDCEQQFDWSSWL